MTCRGRRVRDERGATLVEFALIVPLLFALVLGIIDFGGAYNDWIAMRQGTREGARQAVTGRVGEDFCGVSEAPNDAVHQLVCTVRDRSNLPADRIRVALSFEGNKEYAESSSLKICTTAQIRSLTGFYSAILDNRVVRTEVQMKIEQRTDDPAIGKDPLVAWSETGFTGTCVGEDT